MSELKRLERRLGLGAVMAISLGAMMGSGIFVLPGVVAPITGHSLWLAYLTASLCVLPAALSKSELATAMPTSGGSYVYLERTFGPLAGTIGGVGLYISLLLKAAFALMGFGAYLSILTQSQPQLNQLFAWGGLVGLSTLQTTAMVLLILIVLVNILGVGKVGGLLVVSVMVSTISLLGLVGVSIPAVDLSHGEAFFAGGAEGFIMATAFVFVAFAGVTKVAAIAEEIHNPSKNISRGILLSLLVATLIYCGVSFVMLHTLDKQSLYFNLKPVYALAQQLNHPMLAVGIAGVAVLTMVSMANAGILAASRFPFAMARDNLLPNILGRIHKAFLTPVWSILLSGLVVGASVVLFDVAKIAKLASAFMIVIYAFESVAVVVLRETRVQWYKPKFKSPFYPWMQVFGIASAGVLAFVMGLMVLWAVLMVVVGGVLLYIVCGRVRTDRRGVLGLRWPAKTSQDSSLPFSSAQHLDQASFASDTQVAVVCFGRQKMQPLVTLGSLLAGPQHVDVVQVTEVPEQIELQDLKPNQQQLKSVRNEIQKASQATGSDISFHPIVSHDIAASVTDITQGLQCRWIVTPWLGFPFYSPTAFLRHRLNCNLVTYKQTPAHITRWNKVLVVLNIDHSNDFLLQTVEKLAHFDSHITLLSYVPPHSDGEVLDFHERTLAGLAQKYDFVNEWTVVRGKTKTHTYMTLSSAYDLLVFEEQRAHSWLGWFGALRYDRWMAQAKCCVLSVRRALVATRPAHEDDVVVERRHHAK